VETTRKFKDFLSKIKQSVKVNRCLGYDEYIFENFLHATIPSFTSTSLIDTSVTPSLYGPYFINSITLAYLLLLIVDVDESFMMENRLPMRKFDLDGDKIKANKEDES